jgi:hypothetical protein
MIRERIDAHFFTVSLDVDDIHTLTVALEGHAVSLRLLDPENEQQAESLHRRAGACDLMAQLFNLAADLIAKGGDDRPELVPDWPAADPAPVA